MTMGVNRCGRAGGWLAALMVSTALGGMALPGAVLAQQAQAGAVQDQRHVFDIPAQALADALPAFGRQAGLQVSAHGSVIQDARTNGVAGTMTTAQALGQLLAGTGISWRLSGSTVILEKVAADGAMTLDPVNVEGAQPAQASSYEAVSEGTGSYAAKAVTIGKTEQTLREIPQSVSVVTRQRMDDQSMTSVAEVLHNAPGVSASGYEGLNAFSRGFGMGAQQDGIQREGTFDGITYDLALFDRVEVLRGPSGLLSGSGEPGGTINYVRKRPLDHIATSGSLSAGSWDNYRATADVTGPLNQSGSVRGRMVAVYRDGDTFYDVGQREEQTVYGVFESDLSPSTTVGLTGIHARQDYIAFWGVPTYDNGSLPDRSAFVGMDQESRIFLDEIAADVKHRFDNDWDVKLSAFRQAQDYQAYGAWGDGTIDSTTGIGTVTAEYDDVNNVYDGVDASVSGPVRLFGQEHRVTAGYNWAGSDQLFGWSTASVTGDILNDHHYTVPTDITSRSHTRTQQSGLYGVARVKVAAPVTLILGGRLSDYSSKSRTEGAGATGWSKGAEANDEFTPYGGAIVDLNRQISVYASYADIFVPQTQMDYQGNVLKPRVGWQAETGIKGAFFDGGLTGSLAVFRIRDENRSTVDSSHTGCSGGLCYQAAGLVQSQGFEAEIAGRLWPGLDITAAYTYTDSKYVSGSSEAGERYGADVTPKHLLKLWGNYRFDNQFFGGDLAGWSVGAGLMMQSDTYTSAVHQDTYNVVSAKVGYDINPSLSASLNVENLFDEEYLRTVGYAGWYNMYGAPRNVTLTLTAKW